MLTRKTVLILGAGSSVTWKMPTGVKLMERIFDLLKPTSDHRAVAPGDTLLRNAASFPNRASGEITAAAQRIAAAITQSLSIDEVLDTFRDDPWALKLGKLAIARVIRHAESQSPLASAGRSSTFSAARDSLVGNWLNHFVAHLSADVPLDRLGAALERLTVINYNYDRCLELALTLMLSRRYGISPHDAEAFVKKLSVLRPYGSVGAFSLGHAATLDAGFRDELTVEDLHAAAAGLRTLGEGPCASELVYEIRYAVQNAHQLVVLGFGFHEQNVGLLKPEEPGDEGRNAYVTMMGVRDVSRGVFLNRMREFGGRYLNVVAGGAGDDCDSMMADAATAIFSRT